jgi:hypothetical protein
VIHRFAFDTVNRLNTIGAMPREPTTQVAFRLADRLLSRVDRHAKRLADEHPGLQFSRADAVRDLLTRALDTTDRKIPKIKGSRA